MDVNQLLQRLSKVRSNGENAWSACCPAHEDRSPSLTVKLLGDGRILLHCFGGCGTDNVLGALGLGMTDLFPEPLKMHAPRVSLPFSPMDALQGLQREAGVLLMLATDIARGQPVSDADADRAAQAAGRIYAAMEVVRA
jgi:DNA primase